MSAFYQLIPYVLRNKFPRAPSNHEVGLGAQLISAYENWPQHSRSLKLRAWRSTFARSLFCY